MNRLITWFNKQEKSKKIQIVLATLFTIVSLAALPVAAWFSHQRHIASVAKINSPATLAINSGEKEDIIYFQMSNIDVGTGENAGSKDFVFRVEGKDVTKYNLQIAHTTNNDFQYSLTRAHTVTGQSDQTDVLYVKQNDTAVYYRKDDPVSGKNVNDTNASGRIYGTDGYSLKSYDAGDERQAYAEPLYWQTDEPLFSKTGTGEGYNEWSENDPDWNPDIDFVNYYVLTVTWEAGKVSNNKETDLIYITAKAAS